LVLAVALIFFPPAALFPTKLSILICLLTSMLLITLELGYQNYLLSNPIAETLGKSSYAIYLWHYPIISIMYWKYSRQTSVFFEIILISLSIALGVITTIFVEDKFRYSRSTAQIRILALVTLVSVAFCATSLCLVGENQVKSKSQMQNVANFSHFDYSVMMRKGTCFVEDNVKFYGFPKSCLPSSSTSPTNFIVGDSHAASLSYGLIRNGLNLGQYTYSGCPPFTGINQTTQNLYRPYCFAVNEAEYRAISQVRPSNVILLANWILYPWFNEASLLKATIERIHSLSPKTRVIVVGGLLQWKPSLPALLVSKNIKPDEKALLNNDEYQVVRQKDLQLSKVASQSNATFVSIESLLCSGHHCSVYAKAQKSSIEPISWDYGHLGPAGSEKIAALLINRLSEEKIVLTNSKEAGK